MENGQLGLDIQKIYERLDSIEELVKLLLVSNLLDELDLISEKDKEEKLLSNELSLYLNTLNIYERKHYKYFDKTCIELDIKGFVSVQDMKEINKKIKAKIKNVIPVFCFEKLNGMKRKRMLEEKISFLVVDKEMHIVEP